MKFNHIINSCFWSYYFIETNKPTRKFFRVSSSYISCYISSYISCHQSISKESHKNCESECLRFFPKHFTIMLGVRFAGSFLFLVVLSTNAAVPINLTVFYESRCPDSEIYFQSQLKPTIDKYPNINLKLVPYGKSTSLRVGEDFEFQCQHGQLECEGNRFHACAINQTHDNLPLQITLTTCLIEDFYQEGPRERAEFCCEKHGVDYNSVLLCANGKEGARLLYEHGIATSKWHPTFIPMILLNNQDANQDGLLSNLEATISNILGRSNSQNVEEIKHNKQELKRRVLSSFPSGQTKLRSSIIILTGGLIAIPN